MVANSPIAEEAFVQQTTEQSDIVNYQPSLKMQSELGGCVYECAHTAPQQAVLVEAVGGSASCVTVKLGDDSGQDILKVDLEKALKFLSI